MEFTIRDARPSDGEFIARNVLAAMGYEVFNVDADSAIEFGSTSLPYCRDRTRRADTPAPLKEHRRNFRQKTACQSLVFQCYQRHLKIIPPDQSTCLNHRQNQKLNLLRQYSQKQSSGVPMSARAATDNHLLNMPSAIPLHCLPRMRSSFWRMNITCRVWRKSLRRA